MGSFQFHSSGKGQVEGAWLAGDSMHWLGWLPRSLSTPDLLPATQAFSPSESLPADRKQMSLISEDSTHFTHLLPMYTLIIMQLPLKYSISFIYLFYSTNRCTSFKVNTVNKQ